MVKLRIDDIELEVAEGTTVKSAAEAIGIEIPSMCFMEGFTNHPSCMVCLVKDKNNGGFFPSCARQVEEGMEIMSESDDVREARKDALDLLLSDHVGDCEAPCRIGCPAYMDIPKMNRLIAEEKFQEALVTVKEEIALPLILGYICSAPCEKVCRRVPVDEAVSICQLKRFVASEDVNEKNFYLPEKEIASGKSVAIIGSGPAGLACAFHLTKAGHECVVYDRKKEAGGSLTEIAENELPNESLKAEIEVLQKFGVQFIMGQNIDSHQLNNEIKTKYQTVVIATGENHNGLEIKAINKETYETDQPGMFACGSVVKKLDMAVKAVAQGKAAAKSVNSYLAGKEVQKTSRMFNSKFGKLTPEEYPEYLKESSKDRRTAPEKGNLKGFTTEEAIREARRCMHCDCRKALDCKLRIYSHTYGADRRKYLFGERKNVVKYNTHDSIVYEPEKCIKCGLCIEIASAEKELTGLAFIGRGFDVQVNVPFGKNMEQALEKAAAKCANACPTGAIAFKKDEFLHKDQEKK